MSLRKRTGKAARYGNGEPLVVVPPADEMRNAHVPAPAPVESEPIARRADGKVVGTEAARALGRRAAVVRAEKRAREQQFVTRLRLAADLPVFAVSPHAQPFCEEAEKFFRAKCEELGRDSDGQVSSGVAAIVRSAAWQEYAGRLVMELATSKGFMFTKNAEDRAVLNVSLFAQGSRLLDSGRQSLLAAHHMQQLEAEARARSTHTAKPSNAHDALVAALADDGKGAR